MSNKSGQDVFKIEEGKEKSCKPAAEPLGPLCTKENIPFWHNLRRHDSVEKASYYVLAKSHNDPQIVKNSFKLYQK